MDLQIWVHGSMHPVGHLYASEGSPVSAIVEGKRTIIGRIIAGPGLGNTRVVVQLNKNVNQDIRETVQASFNGVFSMSAEDYKVVSR